MKQNRLLQKYDDNVNECKIVFVFKLKEYGASWRVMRLSTVVDQLYMKIIRIRTIEEKGYGTITESIDLTMMAVVNYAVIALIQTDMKYADDIDIFNDKATQLYEEKIKQARDLMVDKNRGYGNAWQSMKRTSLTDIILTKILRCQSLIQHQNNTDTKDTTFDIINPLKDNFYDIINYAIFYLIQ